MTALLTKPIVVPEYLNGLIKLYTADASGQPKAVAKYTINLQTVLNSLFPGRTARPNCCKLLGVDLFVSQSSDDSQAVLKFPGYLTNPVTAIANAFNFTFDGSPSRDAYLDLAFDALGNMYVAEDQKIVRYMGTAAATPPNGATSNNYTGKTVLGNAGAASFFANLAFDPAGNLWVSDYLNNRLVVFGAAGLGQADTGNFHVLANLGGSLAVANSDATLKAKNANFLFTSPEGIDFDAFGNLWVGNNNDFGNADGAGNGNFTTLVKIAPGLQSAVLATPSGGTLPAAQVVPNTNCFIYNVPDGTSGRPQFGGLQVDRAGNCLYVNEEVDRKGRAYNLATIAATPATAADSILAITSTNPGNGGLSLIQLGPYVADTPTDHGAEPDTTTTTPWESLAISVRQSVYTGSGLPLYQDAIGGQTNQVYVEIANFSKTSSTGIEALNLYWASASLGLKWPQPWDGKLPLGGMIKLNVAIPVIPGSGSVVVGPIAWMTPNPAAFGGDAHFCLLARIVTPGFHDPAVTDPLGLSSDGMSFAESSDIVVNALANARIGWRNVVVLPAGTAPSKVRASVVLANFEATAMHAAVRLALIDAAGEVVPRVGGRLTVTPGAGTRAAFEHSSIGGQWHDGEEIGLPEGTTVIERVTIQPGQQVALELGYTPEPPNGNFAVRVSQTVIEDGGVRLIGGSTFVKGVVTGFPIEPSDAGGVIIRGVVSTTTNQPIVMIKVSVYQGTRLLNKVYTDNDGRYEVAVPSGQMLAILFDTHPTLNNARMWHPSVVLNLAAGGPITLDRTLVQVGQTGGYIADIDAFMAYQFGTFILEEGSPGAMDETYAKVAVERLNELMLTSTYLNQTERDLVAYLSAKQ